MRMLELGEKARYAGSYTPNETYILKRNSLRDPMDLFVLIRGDPRETLLPPDFEDDCNRGSAGTLYSHEN